MTNFEFFQVENFQNLNVFSIKKTVARSRDKLAKKLI